MKWSKLKKMIDEIIQKEEFSENQDPEIAVIDISVGTMQINQEILIHIENGELEIF